MKAVVFILFCLVLFFSIQKTTVTNLSYFSLFPMGFITLFYFYDSRKWFFFGLSISLLAASCLFLKSGFFLKETMGLFAATVSTFGLLIYFQSVRTREVQEEESNCEKARTEFLDLKNRHSVRMESLLHLEKQVASLINLFEIARDFNECLDFKETSQILFKKVLPELYFKRAELILVSPEKDPMKISKAYLITAPGVEEKTSFDGVLENQWVARTLREKAFVSQDDMWLFPLILEGEFNGLFAVQSALKEDLAKFEVLASQLALQVRKIRLYEMVRELSIIDGLTGVFVRRHFLERFEDELRRALKHSFPLSVLMLDIDHFKRYNDDFGHLVGDATLKEVSQVIRSSVRNVDIIARYGGEEFCIVVPETKEVGALEVAERIRSAVARKSFRVYDEETKVTVSIGVSVFPLDISGSTEKGYDPNLLFELIQEADRALYRAKEEGRNRVVLYHSLERH